MTSTFASSRSPIPSPMPTSRHYPHVQDLIARTNGLRVEDRASIKSWIELANQHWMQAQGSLNIGALDTAYVDYLLSCTILAEIIPRCPEYPTFKAARSKLYRDYEEFRNKIGSKTDEFEKVKQAIIKDNEVSGVLSTDQQLAAVVSVEHQSQSNNSGGIRRSNARKPDVRSKPDFLRHKQSASLASVANGVNENGSATRPSLDLEARFKKLTTSTTPTLRERANPEVERSAPLGPRQMPSKLPPLSVKSLPQLPAPTYSPSTSFSSPGGLSPPRSSKNPLSQRCSEETVVVTINTIDGPNGNLLTAKSLYEALRSNHDILILDVRNRDDFEAGHIFAPNIICVDPISIREGMSGEELEDTFVISSNHEAQLFKRRNHFDRIVFYDQSTTSNDFLKAPPGNNQERILRHLHEALWDYGYDKRPKNPPCILTGGLNAWIELMGSASLRTSEAVSSRDVTHSVSGFASVATRTHWRPVLDQKVPPINIEEEKKWLEQLQRESDPMTITTSDSLSNVEDSKTRRRATSIVASNTSVQFPRTVEEFFQRYPASPHGRETMSHIPPSPLEPQNTIIDHPFHVFSDVRNPDFHPPAPPSRPPPAVPRKSYSGVSERPSAATPPPVPVSGPGSRFGANQSSIRVPSSGNISVGKTGLKNLGNTCYMNSILQCMSGTTPLARYFLCGSYKAHINKENALGSRGVLAEAFANVIRHLWSGEYKFISPVTFKDVSGRLNETFSTSSQQDAQEFLEFLLDGLHEDLNPNANRTKLAPLTEQDERKRESLPIQIASQIEWGRYTHQNNSVVVNWLQGQLTSKLRCLTCETTSTTYTPFMYLSLPIPHPRPNAKFTLYDCLQEFMKEETLDGEDAWNCSKCKCARKATKRLIITRMPPILIIHLKRFATRGRWGDKLNTPIEFPLVHLNLTKYVPAPLTPQAGKPSKPEPPETTPPFIYDLYGVVNHFGTLSGGHYTSYVKDNHSGTWNGFDDSKATGVPEGQIASKSAYVLFWVRKGVM